MKLYINLYSGDASANDVKSSLSRDLHDKNKQLKELHRRMNMTSADGLAEIRRQNQ
jgi:hypothetical protein